MNIDWSKKPEGASHFRQYENYFPELGCGIDWYKKEAGIWFFWSEKSNFWKAVPENSPMQPLTPCRTAWTGEGLPPDGTVCEYRAKDWEDWVRCEVLCFGNEKAFVRDVEIGEQLGNISSLEFRPIRTLEEIAAHERAAAVSAMLADAGVTDSAWNDDPETVVWAEALYDAGYRKQVQP